MRFIYITFLCCFAISGHLCFAQKTATQNSLHFYLTDLISAGSDIQNHNYEEVIYQKVCPYMDGLHSMELNQTGSAHPARGAVSIATRQKLLEEVVQVYGRVFDFSDEHYLMYCIYNYYKSKKTGNEIFKITQQVLSNKKQKQFKGMWEICDREEKTGNGDNPQISAKNPPIDHPYLLPTENYKNMSSSLRLSYIKKIKKAFLQLELNQTGSRQAKSSQMENLIAFLKLSSFFIEPSFAQFQGRCLIGGNMRPLTYSKRLKRKVCPIYGNSCGGSKNNFKCGPIFNNKCIPINPVRSMSQRCYQASQKEPVNPEDYKEYKSFADNVIKQYCIGRRAKRAGCINFINRIKQINNSTVKAISPKPVAKPLAKPLAKPSSAKETANTKTEADVVCTGDCPQPKKKSIIENIVQAIQNAQTQDDSEKDIARHFADIISDTATCKCGSNDACKRGCQPKGTISKNQSPPVVQCRGRKKESKSTGNCMRHVTGSIMSTIHQKLAIYCDEAPQTSKDYSQCVRDFRFPSRKNNICRNSFVFPSALCALNLDGNSSGDFQKIQNKKVRKECKKWDKLNRSLTTFPIKQDDGTVRHVPLFKKIPLEGQDFQSNPDKIPQGAIVVMQSPSKHGHAEIRTSKNNCGKDKNQACFCSDFCRGRAKYNATFKIQAVFQWNPEIIAYAKQRK